MTRDAAGGTYDALLVVSFGGPERPEDVIPFLENVLAGKRVPRERMLAVAEHYHHFGGVSPINGQVREMIGALRPELERRGLDLPIYWGNRNWHPMLADTMKEMVRDGRQRALALVTSAYSSYSGCRQYRENIEAARLEAGPDAPEVHKIRVFYNHPEFIAANADRVAGALAELDPERRAGAHVLFSAHSIPRSMADGCDYEQQLAETVRLVGEALDLPEDRRHLVYQSRSGRPTDPWLEPDVGDHMRALAGRGVGSLVVHPVGFLSDHMEVRYDLDEEAREIAEEAGVAMIRSSTVGTHPRFIAMLGELVAERAQDLPERKAAGRYPAAPDFCRPGCCARGVPGPPAAPQR